jgi:hypothetical protein
MAAVREGRVLRSCAKRELQKNKKSKKTVAQDSAEQRESGLVGGFMVEGVSETSFLNSKCSTECTPLPLTAKLRRLLRLCCRLLRTYRRTARAKSSG